MSNCINSVKICDRDLSTGGPGGRAHPACDPAPTRRAGRLSMLGYRRTMPSLLRILVVLVAPITLIRLIPLISLITLTPSLPAFSAPAAGLPAIIERVRPAVVGVGTAYPPRQPLGGKPPNQLLGTGFAVADGTLVATNDHVLPASLDSDNRQVLAVFVGRGRDAVVRAAPVAARDPAHDLALLRVPGAPLPTLELGRAAGVREGDLTAFTGFPIGAVLGLYPVTHTGIVSSITPLARPADRARDLTAAQLRRMRAPYDVFQLDAIAYPGNSGSPVYRADTGEVIGVLNSVFVKESREALLERPSGISYAIPASHLRALLASIEEGG
ncbi:MAG: S1C family serine protease [Pseudohaliea sp.]